MRYLRWPRRLNHLAAGDHARDAKQWRSAVQHYRIGLRRNPINPPIWVQYGHALKESGHWAEAEIAYRRSLDYDANVADTHLQLGYVLNLLGKKNESSAAFVRAFVLDPALSYARNELRKIGWSDTQLDYIGDLIDPIEDKMQQPNPGIAKLPRPMLFFPDEGLLARISVSGVFDREWYLERNPDVAGDGIDPLRHYLQSGELEGRDPHPRFDASRYLARNPDVADSGMSPLVHYVTSGRAEGREPWPVDKSFTECRVLEIPYEIWRSPKSLSMRDVCLFATYSPDGNISDYVFHYLNAFIDNGFTVILVIATDGLANELPHLPEKVEGIIVRTAHGRDWGAWACGLSVFPDLWKAKTLIMANDSLFGPIDPEMFRNIIQRIRSSQADVIGLTNSFQIRPHIQSYFVAYTRIGLRSQAIREFWSRVTSLEDKDNGIQKHEIGLSDNLSSNGVNFEALFPMVEPSHAATAVNPTLTLWDELIDRGFPFLKVQLLRDRLEMANPKGWEARVKDQTLLRSIHAHLTKVRQAQAEERSVDRPIPAPRRRFRRKSEFRTSYGAVTACRPTELTDLALEVPFGYVMSQELSSIVAPVAVILHLHYAEMSNVFIEYLSNIPIKFDTFISIHDETKKTALETLFSKLPSENIVIRVVPNVGRDIAAMLLAFNDVFEKYDIVLHIHSKSSPHDPRLFPWRNFLLDNLLGNEHIVRSILDVLMETDVGVVFSQHFPPVREILNFGQNFERIRHLIKTLNFTLTKDIILEFPSGTFFWARSDAIRPLLRTGLAWNDFPPEPAPIDGTLAHAIERSLLYFCEAAGRRWVKVADRRTGIGAQTLVPVFRRSDLGTAVTRVHRWLIGNPVRPVANARRIVEVNMLSTRRDDETRPRLNMIIPTLKPEKFFGGQLTAINLFNELAGHLGAEFDYRIISGEDVDLLSMTQFPEYCLLPIGAIFDNFPRVIVDASDAEIGELSLRSRDVFIATAWWTAVPAYALQNAQQRYFGKAQPVIYLIQDHEPGFYGWSARYAAAQRTYTTPAEKIAIVNSEELSNFLINRYKLKDVYTLPYQLNPVIEHRLRPLRRERIIVCYGRPTTPRNCFELLAEAITLWQQSDPVEATRWRIISAGEDYGATGIRDLQNLRVVGKLTLEEYANVLSKASIGISLMMSPHPSYPPLEMASAGLVTITNEFENKDLSRRSTNIVSVSLTIEAIASALADAVTQANDRLVGTYSRKSRINSVPTLSPLYDGKNFAARLARMVGGELKSHNGKSDKDLIR